MEINKDYFLKLVDRILDTPVEDRQLAYPGEESIIEAVAKYDSTVANYMQRYIDMEVDKRNVFNELKKYLQTRVR